MTVQFDRVVEVQAGGLTVLGQDVSFKVVKTRKKEPNTCELTIYNLREDRRDQLAEAESAVVKLSAGYRGRETESTAALQAVDSLLGEDASGGSGVGLIYLGDVRDISSTREGVNWITTLESGDGEKATQFERINKSFPAGTSLQTAIKEAARAMKVGLGNALKKASEGSLIEAGSEFLNGLVLSGNASKQMDRIVKSAGLEWSIQDGVIQLLAAGESLTDTSVVLTSTTGLIGSPTIGNDGVVRARSLMNSEIVPARQIELTSKTVTGRFRVERCEYIGSTFDKEFYVDIEASETSSTDGKTQAVST